MTDTRTDLVWDEPSSSGVKVREPEALTPSKNTFSAEEKDTVTSLLKARPKYSDMSI